MTMALRIGDLAKRTGKSVHTIRWYEARGLVPGVARDAGGRRGYHPRHVDWLEFIARLCATGMTIARIADYARLVRRGRQTLPERIALLEEQRSRVEARQRELLDAQAIIAAKIDYYDQWRRTGERPARAFSVERARGSRGTLRRRSQPK